MCFQHFTLPDALLLVLLKAVLIAPSQMPYTVKRLIVLSQNLTLWKFEHHLLDPLHALIGVYHPDYSKLLQVMLPYRSIYYTNLGDLTTLFLVFLSVDSLLDVDGSVVLVLVGFTTLEV